MESGDWRAQLQADSRQRIVNKIIDTMKSQPLFSGHQGLHELKKIAVRFEEKIYAAATSQSDYLRKIALEMLTMETTGSQNPMPDAMQANSAANCLNPSDPVASLDSTAQTGNPNGRDWQEEVYQKEMDTSNWRPTQGPSAVGDSMESGDWRAQLQADSRRRIVNRIMDTLKRHLPFSGHEGQQELKKIAVMFEEKIYTTATSQSDYLRKISLKMLTMETRPQNPMPDAKQANSVADSTRKDMDTSNWRPTQGPSGAVGDSMESGDWRAQLQADSRRRIVNKIMDTLKRHLPFSGHEGLQELKKIAVRFEEKIYTTATSQSDYLRKISLKMLTMETRSQNTMPDAMQANSAANSINPSDPGSQVMPQVNNQGQQLLIPVPSSHA